MIKNKKQVVVCDNIIVVIVVIKYCIGTYHVDVRELPLPNRVKGDTSHPWVCFDCGIMYARLEMIKSFIFYFSATIVCREFKRTFNCVNAENLEILTFYVYLLSFYVMKLHIQNVSADSM